MEEIVDGVRRNDEPTPEADGGDLAAPDEVVGEPPGDSEELAGALDGDRQRLVLLLGVHDP
jgi:hypothetical protein